MKAILVLMIVLGSIPFILYRPYYGILMWSWIGYMSPHRFAGGFIADKPIALLIAVVTVIAVIVSKDKEQERKIPWAPPIVVLVIFIIWMSITTQFAFEPAQANIEWERVLKIQAAIFLTLYLINSKFKLNLLVWIIVLSIGFYGVKGGVFGVLTGGNFRIWGPSGTFIEGNNELAIALVLILPLIRYLQLQCTQKALNLALMGLLGLCTIAILITYSRGAFISLIPCFAMMIFFSKHRKVLFLLVAIGSVGGYMALPEQWFDRMNTIDVDQEDQSMQGRYDAWNLAFEVAKDHPLTGGGYRMFSFNTYEKYGKQVDKARDAHSIYFEVLGEHGFAGLLLYLAVNVLGFMVGFKIRKLAGKKEEYAWAKDLAIMIQIAMVCWAIGGAFKGLAYWDLPYHYIAILVIVESILKRAPNEENSAAIEFQDEELETEPKRFTGGKFGISKRQIKKKI
ncbi:MAG: putative O-glycosylation ligase, exosortase A system-associated [Gammaproteobacteria bacterium]|nr:MAG: putative O-glycosylation ligase, exosortase A system-associated [Gammaproteobacteria bacterium]